MMMIMMMRCRFKVYYALSAPTQGNNWGGLVGRINPDLISSVIISVIASVSYRCLSVISLLLLSTPEH